MSYITVFLVANEKGDRIVDMSRRVINERAKEMPGIYRRLYMLTIDIPNNVLNGADLCCKVYPQ